MRNSRLPIWLVMVAALALALVPVPGPVAWLAPPWVTLAVIYWVLMRPAQFGVISAWIVGLVLDVAQGSLLGQHALTLALVAWVVLRFHLQIRVFPLWQLTLTVLALLATEAFLNLWIDGVTGHASLGLARWGGVVSGAVLWPVVMALMDRVRERLERRATRFA